MNQMHFKGCTCGAVMNNMHPCMTATGDAGELPAGIYFRSITYPISYQVHIIFYSDHGKAIYWKRIRQTMGSFEAAINKECQLFRCLAVHLMKL